MLMPRLSAAPFVPETHNPAVLRESAQECRGCDLYHNATQAVLVEMDAAMQRDGLQLAIDGVDPGLSVPDSLCPAILLIVTPEILPIFEQEYRALRPRAPMPPIAVRFRRFTSLNTTIRLRESRILVSLSDLLEGAPEPVLRAIAHILLAKLYKKPIEPMHNLRYKRFASTLPSPGRRN